MNALRRERRRDGKRSSSDSGPAGPGGKLTSFREGFETLPRALFSHLRQSVRLEMPVSHIARSGNGWQVTCGNGETISAGAVVLACPAWSASPIVNKIDPSLSEEMAAIAYASIAVVSLGYRSSELSRIPDGFGFLVPRRQGPRILGCLWSSAIFPHRAPPGYVLLHTMIGGAHDPDGTLLSDGELVDTARTDLQATMNLSAVPQFEQIFRYPRGIAQYRPGHQARLFRMKAKIDALPGLFISGSAYGGISVNHCVDEAPGVAGRIIDFFNAT